MVLLLFGIRALGASYSATRWPFTPGRIVRSQLRDSPPGGFQVEYEYILGGRLLRSDRVRSWTGILPGVWPEKAPSRSEAESVVQKYRVGLELPVRYDPGDVRRSVLEPRTNWLALVPLLTGLIITTLGIRLLRRDWWPAP
jgi:hypothetical protein